MMFFVGEIFVVGVVDVFVEVEICVGYLKWLVWCGVGGVGEEWLILFDGGSDVFEKVVGVVF